MRSSLLPATLHQGLEYVPLWHLVVAESVSLKRAGIFHGLLLFDS